MIKVIFDNDFNSKYKGIKANDLFKIDGGWYILVNTNNGYSLSGMNYKEYVTYKSDDAKFNMKMETIFDIENLLLEVEKELEVVHYPKDRYNFELKISNKD